MSKHAVRRCQQRGIRPCVVDLILAEHDRSVPVGDAAVRCSSQPLLNLLDCINSHDYFVCSHQADRIQARNVQYIYIGYVT